MKVIAFQGGSQFLVSMDVWELAALSGKHVHEIDAVQQARVIGKEFEICKAWEALRGLNRHRDELANAAGRLRAVADLLQPIVCEVNRMIDEPKAESVE